MGFCDNDSVFRILCLSFRDLGLVFGIFLILSLAFLGGSGQVNLKYLHFQQLFVNEPKLF